MFSKSIATISSLLFFLVIDSQITNAQHIHPLPDSTSIPNPAIFLRDPQGIRNSSQQMENPFSESEPEIYWCAPIGLGLENELENTSPDKSSDNTTFKRKNSDDCVLLDTEEKN